MDLLNTSDWHVVLDSRTVGGPKFGAACHQRAPNPHPGPKAPTNVGGNCRLDSASTSLPAQITTPVILITYLPRRRYSGTMVSTTTSKVV